MTHKLSQSLLNIYTFSHKSTYAEVRDAAPEYAQAALQHYLAQRLRTTALPQPHPLPLHSTSSFLQVLPLTKPLGEGASSHHTSHLATAACQMSPGPAAAVTIGWPRPRTRTPTSVRQMPPGQSIPSATPTNSSSQSLETATQKSGNHFLSMRSSTNPFKLNTPAKSPFPTWRQRSRRTCNNYNHCDQAAHILNECIRPADVYAHCRHRPQPTSTTEISMGH